MKNPSAVLGLSSGQDEVEALSSHSRLGSAALTSLTPLTLSDATSLNCSKRNLRFAVL